MLFRKMLRDMKMNKAQFISIFLMALLGVFVYSGVGSEWNGLQRTSDEYYVETNLADAWMYGSDYSEKDAVAVADVDGVNGVERRLTLDSIADFDNKPTVTLHFVQNNQISTCKLIEGEEFEIEKDGVWLDSMFADKKGLNVGDTITFNVNGYLIEKTIKGTVMSPEYVYSAVGEEVIPNHANYGFGYLSYQAFPKDLPFFYTDLLISTEREVDNKLENAIEEALGGKYSVILTRDNKISYMQFEEEIKSHKAVGQIFPIAFLTVAILTILTTMARLVNNQRTQIGILKALGFQRRRILYHYISYGLWISMAGAMIGAIAGPLTLPFLFFEGMKTTYTLPEWKSAVPLSVIYMIIFSVGSCTLITYLTCRNVLKDTPSQTLRPKAPKAIKHSVFDKTKLWCKFSFHTQWNLRDIFRCKGRSVMAIVGIIGCSALLICAFGMQDSMKKLITLNYEKINQYNTKLELSQEIKPEQIQNLMEEYQGEAILEGAVELKANGERKSGGLLVTEDVKLIHFVDKNRNLMEIPKDSISITYKMAGLLKVKVGDEISWHIYGDENWVTSKIGAIYRTPFSQGITMSKDCFEELGFSFTPTAIITGVNITGEVEGISQIETKEKLMESMEKFMEVMNLVVYVLVIAAILLAAVVIYNLGVLSFTERQRELSTLKVIGFKTKKLRTLLLTQNIWLTAVGILMGIPVGMWILSYVFTFMGEVFDFMIFISVYSYIYCIAGTFLISILVNRLFSKRVRGIDMVSALKGVE